MFLCVSLNPAIDKRLKLRQFRLGKVNRVLESRPAPGGKAAHVAMVLRTLGADPLWLGFAGGAAGTELIAGLRQMSIRTEAVSTKNSTRTNLEIVDDSGVTEILEPGPAVTEEEIARLRDAMTSIVRSAANTVRVIFSGSLPNSVCASLYGELIATVHDFGGKVFLDVSGEPLKRALSAGPDFIKPNQEEAEIWQGSPISDLSAAKLALNAMLQAGATAGALSLGQQGLLLRPSNQAPVIFLAKAPPLATISSVGSGDAALAGFAFASAQGLSAEESARLAAACGAANCLAEGPGLATAEDIRRMKGQISVEKLA